MLESLYAKNLALIDEIQVDFLSGLTIMTGETGAGKSIILGCINLALGARYQKDMLREGADYGLVELQFSIKNNATVDKLKKMDIFLDGDMLTLQRKFLDGKSISKINGETVSMTQLKEVSALLIDIHGQHEHQSLLQKKNHVRIVDLYNGEIAETLKGAIKALLTRYNNTMEKLLGLKENRNEKKRVLDLLEFEVNEIIEADLKPDEDVTLEKDYAFMTHARTIKSNLAQAYQLTGESCDSATEQIARAIRLVTDARRYDENIESLSVQLVDVDGLLSDFNREISEYMSGLEFSDDVFSKTESRLNEINRLKSKYGDSIDAILLYKEKQEEEINRIYHIDETIDVLQKQAELEHEELQKQGEKLHVLRKKTGIILEQEIKNQMKDLNFEDTGFKIVVRKSEKILADGCDMIEFLVSLNPGEPLKSLTDVASGGELSRMMLAIKTVMAKKDEVETLIFDEIDVGISGRTAQKVSEKLALIGRNHQVLAITHLPQITAMADTHYLIEKRVCNGKTKTNIRKLDQEGSIMELSRMIGGASVTDNVIQSAKEMKELAKKKKESMS